MTFKWFLDISLFFPNFASHHAQYLKENKIEIVFNCFVYDVFLTRAVDSLAPTIHTLKATETINAIAHSHHLSN